MSTSACKTLCSKLPTLIIINTGQRGRTLCILEAFQYDFPEIVQTICTSRQAGDRGFNGFMGETCVGEDPYCEASLEIEVPGA